MAASPSLGPLPVIHLSMGLLRVGTGLALIYYQGWTQVRSGWAYLWGNQPWPLVQHFVGRDHPVPLAVMLSWVVSAFFFLSPLLLALGFLTRLNALLIFCGLVLALSADLDGVLSTSLYSQTVSVYFLVSLFFILNGGGWTAADRLFDRHRGRLRRAGGLYS